MEIAKIHINDAKKKQQRYKTADTCRIHQYLITVYSFYISNTNNSPQQRPTQPRTTASAPLTQETTYL
jgi:hypothetical protein